MADGDAPPHPGSDAEIRAALDRAHIPVLMACVMHMEGSDAVWNDVPAPRYDPLDPVSDGLPEAARTAVRERASSLMRLGGAERPVPEAAIARAMVAMTGEPVPDAHLPFLREELPIGGAPNRPAWGEGEAPPNALAAMRVAVVGGGLSGVLAGVRLARAGVPYAIFERSDEPGGVWRDNVYPGCRVDTPNHVYSYSFAPRSDWPAGFSTRDVLRGYVAEVAERFGVTPHLRLGRAVRSGDWDEAAGLWRLEIDGPDGPERFEATALVLSTGQLNVPRDPDLPGLNAFAGPRFHSARWDHSVDLSGARVAVIGTGASATQFVPEIAPEAARLTILQRSPPWLVPTPNYHHPVPEAEAWLMRNVPHYAAWHRFWLFRRDGSEAFLDQLRIDPGWRGEGAVSAGNDALRRLWVDYLREQAGGDEALLARITPDYPPCAKRPLRDNGSWVATLRRPNVELVTDRVERVKPGGVRLATGRLIEADALVYGTGFRASRFFGELELKGRDGASLRTAMEEPRAHRGVQLPGFPNVFALYGPNTNTVVGAGIVYFAECAMRYAMGCLNLLAVRGDRWLDARREPFEAYNSWIDAENARFAWGAPGVSSWYKGASGRVTQNWPGTHHDFWAMTRAPDPAEHDFG